MRYLLVAHQQESFLPFSSRQSLSCCLSRVAKRSTPKPHGPLYSPSELCGPFPHFRTSWPSTFPLRTSWCSLFFLLQNHMDLYLSTCFRTSWFPHLLWSRVVYSLFTLEPRGLLFSPPKPCGTPQSLEPRGLFFSMAARPRFKSQRPSSFAAPFLTPPTVSYTCQHPCILPALLGCHSKSGQV